MTTSKRLVSVRVDVEVWKAARLRAVQDGRSVAELVETALRLFLARTVPLVTDDGEKSPARQSSPREPESVDPVLQVRTRAQSARPSPDTRCVCGEQWAFHQSGDSKTIARKTNCRNFREAE